MQIRTSIALAAAFTAGMALVPMSARAVCQQTIYAEFSFTDGTNTQIAGRPNLSTPYTYLAVTTSPVISAQIFAAVAHRSLVSIVGDVASCPPIPTTVPVPAGTSLDIGNILQIFQYP